MPLVLLGIRVLSLTKSARRVVGGTIVEKHSQRLVSGHRFLLAKIRRKTVVPSYQKRTHHLPILPFVFLSKGASF